MKTYSRSYSDKQGTHVCKHTNMMRVANKHPHTHTRTQWGLEVCHARWQRHAWRMALSTVVHATESQRVCSSTSFTRQWYRKDGCHTGKKITHLPGLWKPNKKTKCDRTENLWDGGKKQNNEWQTVSAPLTVTIWLNYNAYFHTRVHSCVLFYHLYAGNVNKNN